MTEQRIEQALPWLPDMLRELAERYGLGVALRLAANFGGQNVYIPKTASEAHPIAQTIGTEAFAALCKKYGGDHVDIPMGPNGQQRKRSIEIARLNAAGKSANAIARAVGCVGRTIFNHRKKLRDGTAIDSRQRKLF